MKRFSKVYLEISNICNLRCSFCPGTRRAPRTMSREEFSFLLPRLRPWTDYLYFHLMGEPLCHPRLGEFLSQAGKAGFKVILTTNGVLLPRQQDVLLAAEGLYKVNISLHAFEANDLPLPFERYLHSCFSFGRAAEGRLTVSYRLWNQGGSGTRNDRILREMEHYFPRPWREERLGPRIGERIYLQHGDKFDWPDAQAPERDAHIACFGLKDQLGILCDGTVVPCCLDHDGELALGNLFEQELDEILASPRAAAIRDGFANGTAVESLCRKCGYAQAKFSRR